jgi:hypothetical protein
MKRPLKPIRALIEKMGKDCPFILPKKAIEFEKEIHKFPPPLHCQNPCTIFEAV